jgi:hypothetical protein
MSQYSVRQVDMYVDGLMPDGSSARHTFIARELWFGDHRMTETEYRQLPHGHATDEWAYLGWVNVEHPGFEEIPWTEVWIADHRLIVGPPRYRDTSPPPQLFIGA